MGPFDGRARILDGGLRFAHALYGDFGGAVELFAVFPMLVGAMNFGLHFVAGAVAASVRTGAIPSARAFRA
jgi:hypothetical protein